MFRKISREPEQLYLYISTFWKSNFLKKKKKKKKKKSILLEYIVMITARSITKLF